MRRLLAQGLRWLARIVVGFFPLVALLFLMLVESWASTALRALLAATAVLLVLLMLYARRDPALGQAVWLGGLFIGMAFVCGVGLAWYFGDGSLDKLIRVLLPARPTPTSTSVSVSAVTPTPTAMPQVYVPTAILEPSLGARRLWHEAAPEWLQGGGNWAAPTPPPQPLFPGQPWPGEEPSTPYAQPVPGGGYQVVAPRPLQGLLVLAPWGRAPAADVLLRAYVHWRGLSSEGVWGVVCAYQNAQRFYALTLRGDGQAAIWKHTPQGAWALQPWTLLPLRTDGLSAATPAPPTPTPRVAVTPTPSPTPTPGLPSVEGWSRFSAECRRGTLRLYVNGALVASAEDPDPEPYSLGAVGLWVVAPPTGRWQVTWLDFDAYLLAR